MATTKRRLCEECGGEIPSHKRSQAKFCTERCQQRTAGRRRRLNHPDEVREYGNRYYHTQKFGHTDFYDDPDLNKRDRFRAARSLGFRSMLEVSVAQQLESMGVSFGYEPLKIPYKKEVAHGA